MWVLVNQDWLRIYVHECLLLNSPSWHSEEAKLWICELQKAINEISTIEI